MASCTCHVFAGTKRVRLERIVRRNMPGQAANCNCGLCRTKARTLGAHSDFLRAQCLKAAPLMTLQKYREELRGKPIDLSAPAR
jgi:hypothetical protein